MEHPIISRLKLTGHPRKEPEIFGNDALGNEVYYGDEIYRYEDEFFLKEELTSDVIQLLEHLGATEEIAK